MKGEVVGGTRNGRFTERNEKKLVYKLSPLGPAELSRVTPKKLAANIHFQSSGIPVKQDQDPYAPNNR
jgi:hypothetical protein